ncbi:MAG: hypothetical protein ABIH11_04235 [Candidatus Altiarchaeota archaeon]
MQSRASLVVALTVFIFLSITSVSADEGSLCCFLDPVIGLFKSIFSVFTPGETTTTTTTLYTTTTTVRPSTTTTTFTTSTSTTSTVRTSTTTTTLMVGECNSLDDCPKQIVEIRCRGNDKKLVTEETTTFYCYKPGTEESACKGKTRSHTLEICTIGEVCVEGSPECMTA